MFYCWGILTCMTNFSIYTFIYLNRILLCFFQINSWTCHPQRVAYTLLKISKPYYLFQELGTICDGMGVIDCAKSQ